MEFPHDNIETPWEHAHTSKSVENVHVKSASVDPVQDAVAPVTRTGDAGTKRKRVQKLRTWRSSGEASAARGANNTIFMEESTSIVDHDHHGAGRDVDRLSEDTLSDDDLPPTKEMKLDKEAQKKGKGTRIRGKEIRRSKDEEEEMWEAVMDRSKAVQGPPTAAQLDHLLATYITLTQNGELVSTSLQKNGLWSGNFTDSNIRINKSGKLNEHKGKQWYCGQYLTAEEAARATDKMKLKGLLCGWQPHLNEESRKYTCTINFHPQVYLDEMSLPEVVAMTNPSPYRYRLMEQAKLISKKLGQLAP